MSRKALIRLSLSLTLLCAAIAVPASLEAACERGHSYVTTYYAYVDNSYPSWYACTIPAISPYCPQCYTWTAIGGISYSECTDTWDSWGDTTTCTGEANRTDSAQFCGMVCNDE